VSVFFRPQHGIALLLFVLGSVALAGVVLGLVHQTQARFKRRLTVLLTFLAGGYYVLEFFLPARPGGKHGAEGNFLSPFAMPIGDVVQVMGGLALGLGIFNLAHVHGTTIRRHRPGWTNSVAFFAAFLGMAVTGFWHDRADAPRWVMNAYSFLFRGLWQNMDAAIFSLLAFYIASAAYRAFRIRSGEALVLMITAMVLMLGQVPVGMALTHWIPEHGRFPFFGTSYSLFRIENFSRWVLMRVNNPVQRAIDFGIGLGALAMGVRIWLSLERGTYFGQAND